MSIQKLDDLISSKWIFDDLYKNKDVYHEIKAKIKVKQE